MGWGLLNHDEEEDPKHLKEIKMNITECGKHLDGTDQIGEIFCAANNQGPKFGGARGKKLKSFFYNSK